MNQKLETLVQLSLVLFHVTSSDRSSTIKLSDLDAAINIALDDYNAEVAKASDDSQKKINFQEKPAAEKVTKTVAPITKKDTGLGEKAKTEPTKPVEEKKLTNLNLLEAVEAEIRAAKKVTGSIDLNTSIAIKKNIVKMYSEVQEGHAFVTNKGELDSFYRSILTKLDQEAKAAQIAAPETKAEVKAEEKTAAGSEASIPEAKVVVPTPTEIVEGAEDVASVLSALNQKAPIEKEGSVAAPVAETKEVVPAKEEITEAPKATDVVDTKEKTEESGISVKGLSGIILACAQAAKPYSALKDAAKSMFIDVFNKKDNLNVGEESISFYNTVFNAAKDIKTSTGVSNNTVKKALRSWIKEWKTAV